jgi:hypothetical protein
MSMIWIKGTKTKIVSGDCSGIKTLFISEINNKVNIINILSRTIGLLNT